MNPEPAELPGPGAALALILASAPLLVLAVRAAARGLPRRPASEDRWPVGQALAVLATPFVLVALLASLARAHGATPPEPEPDVLAGLLGTQLVFAATAGLALALAARRRGGLAGLGLSAAFPPGAVARVALVYLPGFFVAAGLGVLWAHLCRAAGWDERQEIMRLILTLERSELLMAAVVAVLLGPLLEELLFRGFLQAWLSEHMGERAALLATSLVFASLHGLAGLPILLLLSLFLGWLQVRTRCLWVPWSAHALNNAVTLSLALALRPE